MLDALPILPRGSLHGVSKIGFSSSSRGISTAHQVGFFPSSPARLDGRINARRGSKTLFVSVASTPMSPKRSGHVSPLQPSSPEGKLLGVILQQKSHLFQFAVSKHLDELVSERNRASAVKEKTLDSMESVLHRRVAKMKERERQIAIEDVMYVSIVHKFTEVGVPLITELSEFVCYDGLEVRACKSSELVSMHSLDVQDMIKEHVTRSLKHGAMDRETTAKIDRLHLGRIYAASVMYGYFLKTASFRHNFQLSLSRVEEGGRRSEELSSYVKGFDSDSLQRCSKLKTREAVNVTEKHIWALFGDENTNWRDVSYHVILTFQSFKRIVLEAVAFGSFLWEVEKYVDSVCGLKEN